MIHHYDILSGFYPFKRLRIERHDLEKLKSNLS